LKVTSTLPAKPLDPVTETLIGLLVVPTDTSTDAVDRETAKSATPPVLPDPPPPPQDSSSAHEAINTVSCNDQPIRLHIPGPWSWQLVSQELPMFAPQMLFLPAPCMPRSNATYAPGSQVRLRLVKIGCLPRTD
jgi:hypothetical protein